MKKILFRSGGGLGKQIMATAVVKMLKEKYPDSIIHVQTSYPEVFTNLDFVDRFFPYQMIPYFRDEHHDFEVFEAEPYMDIDYRHHKLHLIESWCKKLDLQAPDELKGIITLDEEEKEIGRRFISETKLDRPLVAVQFFGGTSYFSPQEANNILRPRQYREIKKEVAQEIVNGIVKAGFAVLQIGLPTEPRMQNCMQLPVNQNDVMNPRYIFAILAQCKFAVCIDSFVQHAWAALGKKDGVVMWGGTNPKTLGYDENMNLSNKSLCHHLHCNRPDTHLSDVRGNGSPWKCVVNGKCMAFEAKNVIKVFEDISKKEEKIVPEPTNELPNPPIEDVEPIQEMAESLN